MAKFEYWQSDKNSRWYWHLLDDSGKVVCWNGQGWIKLNSCLKEINYVKNNAYNADVQPGGPVRTFNGHAYTDFFV